MPSVKSIRKNKTAQIGPTGKFDAASGYVIKASPVPPANTLLTPLLVTFAIKPIIPKTANPAKKLVKQSTHVSTIASLIKQENI
jgi:hypothetical protein